MARDKETRMRQRVIKVRKRRQSIEKMMERGITNQHQIAARLNVCQTTISKDVRWIIQNWVAKDPKEATLLRAKRIHQLEAAARSAWDSYERSKADEQTVTVFYSKRICEACRGKGVKPGQDPDVVAVLEWCIYCDGKGEIEVTNSKTSIKGQPGDSSYLRVIKDCVTECAKLEGLHPKDVKQTIDNRTVNILHNNPYKDAPSESILEAMAAMEKLDHATKNGNRSKVIDVAVVKSKESEE